MSAALSGCLAAALVAFALTPFFRHLGRRLGWTDMPNERSSHRVPTPRNGGKAIMLGIAAGVVVAEIHRDRTMLVIALLAGVVSMLGAIDDRQNLRWTMKLAVQLGAAIALVLLSELRPGVALSLVAIFWITGVTNAFNFMDGVNGIASLQATICGLTIGALLLAVGDVPAGALSFSIGGAAFGFFLWNGLTGSIFMGDVGSLPLGFLLAALVVRGATAGLEPWVLALPLLPFLLDTGSTLVRRTFRRERIFEAHRTHSYQRLTDLGWSHLSVALLWGALAASGSAVALAWDGLGSRRAVALGSVLVLHLLVFVAVAVRHARWRSSTDETGPSN